MTKPRVGKYPPGDATHRHQGADADADAFAREMRDVRPLQPDVRGRARAVRQTRLPTAVSPVETPADGGVEAFTAPGVDRRELRKLKRGDYLAADRTDLHGVNAVDACARTGRFLENSRHRGYRCVCIVHGRGLHSADAAPVLRMRVREFLRSHRSVLAYADAPSSDGGAGAVYVLLRK